MHYLICDEKLGSSYNEKIEKIEKAGTVKFEKSLKIAIDKLEQGKLFNKNKPWTLLVHSNNIDFEGYIIDLVVKIGRQLKELYLISTEDPLLNIPDEFIDKIKKMCACYDGSFKTLARFTPDIYLNQKAWEKVFKTGSFDRSLFVREYLEYLPALAILCQGYLVAGIAAKKINVDEIKDDEIKTLSSLNKIPQGESPGIRDRWQEVINAEWWKIFSDVDDLKPRLEKELNKVLEEGENLTKLVGHIIKKEAVEDYKIVKSAYFTIHKALVGEK